MIRSSYTTQTPSRQTSPLARSKQTQTTQWKAASFVMRLSQVSLYQRAGWRVHCGAYAPIRWHSRRLTRRSPPHLLPAAFLLTSTWHLLQHNTNKIQFPFSGQWKPRPLGHYGMVQKQHPTPSHAPPSAAHLITGAMTSSEFAFIKCEILQ